MSTVAPEHAEHVYRVTFLSHLDEWAADSLVAVDRAGKEYDDASTMLQVNITRPAGGGLYPVPFLLGYDGDYELSISSNDREIAGSPFEVTAFHGPATSAATTIASDNINSGIAGDQITLDVHARDHRQHEIQIVAPQAVEVPNVPEVQRVIIGSSDFILTFRGADTATFTLGGTTGTLADDLMDLATINGKTVTVTEEGDGSGTLEAGEAFKVTFDKVYGDLPMLTGDTTTHISEVTKGDAPYVHEVQTFSRRSGSGARRRPASRSPSSAPATGTSPSLC
jgi:hypothetical protein